MLNIFSHNIFWSYYFPFPNFSQILPIFLPIQLYAPTFFSLPQKYPQRKIRTRKQIKINKTNQYLLSALGPRQVWWLRGPWQWVVLWVCGNHKGVVIGQKKRLKMAQGIVESVLRGWIPSPIWSIFFFKFSFGFCQSCYSFKKSILGLIDFMYCCFEPGFNNFCFNLYCFLPLTDFVFLLSH